MKTLLLMTFLFMNQSFARMPKVFSKPSISKIRKGEYIDLNICMEQASNHGALQAIDNECFKTLLVHSSHIHRDFLENDNVLAIGYENLLIIKSKVTKVLKSIDQKSKVMMTPQYYKIAGSDTLIHQIESIAFSPSMDKIAVLNRTRDDKKQILIFPTYRSGNFSPLKVIELDAISKNIVKIDFKTDDFLLILDGDLSKLSYISAVSDSRHHDEMKRPRVMSEMMIKGMDKKKLTTFTIKEDHVLIGDRVTNKIFVLNSLCNGSCEALQEVTVESLQSCDIQYLDFTEGEVTVINSCDEVSILLF
jgi:hypothetical protein